MPVKLRLKRMGKKHSPFYRIVAADARSPRDGRFIETVGTYNPVKDAKDVKIDEEKVMYWLNNGAMPTDTVRNILSAAGVMKKFADSKTKKAPKKSAAKTEVKETKKTTAKKTTTKKAK